MQKCMSRFILSMTKQVIMSLSQDEQQFICVGGRFWICQRTSTIQTIIVLGRAQTPAKWMPPETLTDGISNEKTDVVRDIYDALHYNLDAHIHCIYATLLYLLLVLAEDIHTVIQKSLFLLSN